MVLVVAILHANHAIGKPYRSQESVDETGGRSFSEANIAPNREHANETSVFRGKRDASSEHEYLKNYCPGARLGRQQSGTRHPCEAGSFVCLGYVEIVCKPIAKCFAIYGWVPIELDNGVKKQVRRTLACGGK